MTVLDVSPGRGFHGTFRVPGDKSIAHRGLVLAAVAAAGPSHVRGMPAGLDVASTESCLRALGVRIEHRGEAGLEIHSGLAEPVGALECGNSGTTMRLLAGVLTGRPLEVTLDGDESLRRRPMGRVIGPLRDMGGHIEAAAGDRAPLRIEGRPLQGIRHEAAVPSAQVKGALLLAGLVAEGPTTVVLPGPSRDHTERMLAALGVDVTIDGTAVTVRPGPVTPFSLAVPGDVSSATFLAAAAAVTGGRAVVDGVGLNPSRTAVLDVLARMGADVSTSVEGEELGEPHGRLDVRGGELAGVTISGDEAAAAIDELPVLCAVAACVPGATELRGAEELRVKESDRLATVAEGLRAFGVEVEERPDGLLIGGRPQRPVVAPAVASHGDHRVALALAVAGLGLAGVRVTGWEAAAVSYAEFAADLAAGGADVAEVTCG